MAFSAVPLKATGDLWSAADHNTYHRGNMLEGIPGKFTAKGQLLAATGSQAGGLLNVGANGTALGYDSAQATGLTWYGGVLPIGMIILWSGAVGAIPSGWQLCNGTNDTPDLRDKFVVGAGSAYAVGASGGGGINLQHTHAPSTANTNDSGAHSHAQPDTNPESGHTHAVSGTITSGAPSAAVNQDGSGSSYNLADNAHTHTVSGSTGISVGSHAHANPATDAAVDHHHSLGNLANALSTSYVPPYYALAYIQRLS